MIKSQHSLYQPSATEICPRIGVLSTSILIIMFVGRKFHSWPSYWHLMLSGGGRANCERLRSDRTPLHFLEQPDSVIGLSSLCVPPSLSPLFSNLSLTLSLILKHHNWHVTRNPPDDNIVNECDSVDHVDHVDLNVNGEDVAVARCPFHWPSYLIPY